MRIAHCGIGELGRGRYAEGVTYQPRVEYNGTLASSFEMIAIYTMSMMNYAEAN
jgi:hypothetical protein